MVEIPATPQPIAERIDKLERENRNLSARLTKLEKGSGGAFFDVVRTALLLLITVVLLHLMGFLPRGLERVSVAARRVEAERIKADRLEVKEIIMLDHAEAGRARLEVADDEPHLTFLDPLGRVTAEVPSKTKP